MEIIERLNEAVLDRDPAPAESTAKEALQKRIDPLEALQKGLIEEITAVGEKYQTGKFFLPDLVMAAEAFKAGINVLEPEPLKLKKERKSVGTIVLGTVAGDIHSVG